MMRGKVFLFLATIFITVSVVLYLVDYFIFQDPHFIFVNLLGSLAYLPLEAFLVVIVIERLLTRREKQAMFQKLNMVLGAFFSEVGNWLLGNLLGNFDNREEISHNLHVTQGWTSKDFKRAAAFAYHLKIDLDCHKVDLARLKVFLYQKRVFVLGLLENPNLLEHDRFTDMLWAVTHLDEELEARPSLENLPEKDLEHLAGDIQRMYDHMASEWLDYVEHLKLNYPFLYSLVLRIHPFQEHPSPVIV